MKERTLAQIVDNFLLLDSDTAYMCRRGYRITRWSYRNVAETSFQLARELQERDIGPDDKVILWGEDCAEWVIAF